MIKTKQDLAEYIREDRRMQPFASSLIARLFSTNSAVVRWKTALRKCEYHHNASGLKLFHKAAYRVYRYRLERYNRRFCSELKINVFGKGLIIWHPERIIINPNARVGDYCSLSSGVVIAQAHDEYPVVGNHVEFMIDSKALGGITIADDTRIGANALVLKTIETPNTTWAGVPARQISDKGARETPVLPCCY